MSNSGPWFHFAWGWRRVEESCVGSSAGQHHEPPSPPLLPGRPDRAWPSSMVKCRGVGGSRNKINELSDFRQ